MEERRRKGWIARARQTRRDAEKDGSCVRRINIYIYIYREREREMETEKSSKLCLDKAIIASERHRGAEMYQCERNNKIFSSFFSFFVELCP